MRVTQYIVRHINGYVRFITLEGRLAYELVDQAEASRFDSQTGANLEAFRHGILGHKVELVWGEK